MKKSARPEIRLIMPLILPLHNEFGEVPGEGCREVPSHMLAPRRRACARQLSKDASQPDGSGSQAVAGSEVQRQLSGRVVVEFRLGVPWR